VKVVALIKQTPDTAELPKVSVDEARSGQIQTTMVINPWDEFAAEEAIQLADRLGATSVAISMGRPDQTDALKHALAMGIQSAVLVDEAVAAEGDEWTAAEALAQAIRLQGDDVQIVLAGKMSVDGNSGLIHVGVACKLGWSLLVNVTRIAEVADGRITVERSFEGGQEVVQVPLPVVISVAKEINEPRYPSFMGIRKANRAQIPVLGKDEIPISPAPPRARWENLRKPEQRTVQVKIIQGATPQEKAAGLVDALLAEKVI